MPLVREKATPAPFPKAALLSLCPVVEAVVNIVQVPDELAVQCVMSAVNYAVQGHLDVDAGFGPRPVSSFWIMSARSGERKTAADGLTWRAVYDHQDLLIAAFGEDDQRPTQNGRPKTSPIILVTEPTVEGLIQHLERSIGSVALATDEGGAFIGGFALSADQVLKTFSKMSSLWDGKPISSLRAGGTRSRFATHKRMNVSIMAQGSVIAKILGSQLAKDQGLLARCLIAEPVSKVGTRRFRRASAEDRAVIDMFHTALRALLARPLPCREGTANHLDPRVVRLSKQSTRLLAEFADAAEAECRRGGRLAPVAGFAAKVGEHAMRLGATLAAWDDIDVRRLDSVYMEAGIVLARWYLDEALRLNGAEIDADLALAEDLLGWLTERKPSGAPFTLVEVYQRGPTAVRSAKRARALMAILLEHGWAQKVSGSVEFDGQLRKEVYELV
jgi:hypothetical protein